jgi:hypothetical protein
LNSANVHAEPVVGGGGGGLGGRHSPTARQSEQHCVHMKLGRAVHSPWEAQSKQLNWRLSHWRYGSTGGGGGIGGGGGGDG